MSKEHGTPRKTHWTPQEAAQIQKVMVAITPDAVEGLNYSPESVIRMVNHCGEMLEDKLFHALDDMMRGTMLPLRTDYMELIRSEKLKLDATPPLPISNSKAFNSIFYPGGDYDPDWDIKAPATSAVKYRILNSDGSLATIIASLGIDVLNLCLTQGQIDNFTRKYGDPFFSDRARAHCLFQSHGHVFVATIGNGWALNVNPDTRDTRKVCFISRIDFFDQPSSILHKNLSFLVVPTM